MNRRGHMKLSSYIMLFSLLAYFTGCSAQRSPESAVSKFVSSRPEYGEMRAANELPDWAYGKRMFVLTSKGEFVFYFYKEDIVSVRNQSTSELIKYKEIPPQYQKNIEITAETSVIGKTSTAIKFPVYTILFSVQLATGKGLYGDVLVDYSYKHNSKEQLESLIKQIAKKENFYEMYLYCTREAYEANMSESYSKAHPGALQDGFLGIIENGMVRWPF